MDLEEWAASVALHRDRLDPLPPGPAPERPRYRRPGPNGEGYLLRDEASRIWGNKCPCCGVPMHDHKTRRQRETPAKMTVGHDGMAGVTPRWRWIYICLRCNQQQGRMRFWGWYYVLRKQGDHRAERVREVAEFIDRVAGAHSIGGEPK